MNITEMSIKISKLALYNDISRDDYNSLMTILSGIHYAMTFEEQNQDLINFYFRDQDSSILDDKGII